MTNVFLVSYDLRTPDADYDDLFSALKGSQHWWHYLESTWLIVTELSSDRLWKKIQSHVRSGDRILIIGVTAESEGLLPEKAWKWIRNNVDSNVTQAGR